MSLEKLLQTKVAAITYEVQKLKEDHVERSELFKKADKVDLQSKADVENIMRVDESIVELSRRLTSETDDIQERLRYMTKTYDEKIEFLYHWVVKKSQSVKLNDRSYDDIRPNTAGGGGKEGIIGRLRCLVCDQTIVQHPETEIVFGGPPFKSTLKSLRSHSPPRAQDHDLTSPTASGAVKPPLSTRAGVLPTLTDEPEPSEMYEIQYEAQGSVEGERTYLVVANDGSFQESADPKFASPRQRSKLVKLAAMPTLITALPNDEVDGSDSGALNDGAKPGTEVYQNSIDDGKTPKTFLSAMSDANFQLPGIASADSLADYKDLET